MKVLLALIVGGVSGALAVRTLRPRPSPSTRPVTATAAGAVDPGPGRVAVDVSAFTD